MTKSHVVLSSADQKQLQHLTSQNSVGVAVWRRAQGLLLLHEGHTLQSVASEVGVCYLTVSQWRDRYQQEGLALLHDKPKSGRPPQIDGLQRAQVTALACSAPPVGYARWSLRLLANKAVELGYVQSLCADSVQRILKKTKSSPI